MYRGNVEAWGKIGRAEGMRGIFTGWAPNFFGYSVSNPALISPEKANCALVPFLLMRRSWLLQEAQGAFRYGGYEFFKKFYSDLAGEEAAYRYKTALYLSASASAEFIADVALCPFKAVKVRM